MTKLDESAIIRIFQNRLKKKKFVSEDVEVFSFEKINIVAKTDTMVQSTDMPPKMKLGDAARKSVVACVSDFAAKGVKPQYGIISVNLPKTISRSKIVEIANGFRRACDEYDISILGGDTNAGKEIVFNVCIFGHSKDIVCRRGSKNNDLIFVTGPFGYTFVGLNMLLDKKRKRKTNTIIIKKAIQSVTRPKPKLDFGLKNKKYFSSSMDSSDGLSTTLNEMAGQSKKKFIISNIPVAKDLEDFAKSQKFDLNKLIFHGGEEYEFVFTASPKYRQTIKKNAKSLGIPLVEIGHVTPGKGVFIQEKNRYIRIRDAGWNHFK